MILRVFLLVSAAAIAGCRFGPSGDKSQVYGSWQWIKTQGARSGSIQTAELSGYTARVVFHEDGRAQFFRNDSMMYEIPFSLSQTNIPGEKGIVFLVHWKNRNFPDNQYILFDGNDTLHLTEMGTEISHYYFVRSTR